MFAGIFGLIAVESFVVDPNAMAAAVAGGLTFGRVLVVGVLVVVGVGLFFKDQLAAVWAESVAAAKSNPAIPQAKTRELTLNVAVATSLEDDLSRGITFLRSLHSIYKKQGMPQSELNSRFLDGVELLLPKAVPEPTMAEAIKATADTIGGAA